MTPTDWAYLAGMVDGEGSITIRRRDHSSRPSDRQRGVSFTLRIGIAGAPDHIRRIQSMVGMGSVYVRRRAQLNKGWKDIAEWSMASREAKQFLLNVEPYLMLKRSQAQVALSLPQCRSRWDATPQMRQEQEECRKLISTLNLMGRGRGLGKYGDCGTDTPAVEHWKAPSWNTPLRCRVGVACGWCGKQMDVLPSRLRYSRCGKVFCNRSCSARYKTRSTGVQGRGRRIVAAEQERMLQLRVGGLSYSEIGREVERPRETVRRIIVKLEKEGLTGVRAGVA